VDSGVEAAVAVMVAEVADEVEEEGMYLFIYFSISSSPQIMSIIIIITIMNNTVVVMVAEVAVVAEDEVVDVEEV